MTNKHLYEALELKKKFPIETRGFDVFQIERIWEEYSESMAAGWLNPDQQNVENVFSDFRIEKP